MVGKCRKLHTGYMRMEDLWAMEKLGIILQTDFLQMAVM